MATPATAPLIMGNTTALGIRRPGVLAVLPCWLEAADDGVEGDVHRLLARGGVEPGKRSVEARHGDALDPYLSSRTRPRPAAW